MRLVLDAMGGDHAPADAVEGSVLFAREHPEHEGVLVGDSSRVRTDLPRTGAPGKLHLHHASEVVEMDDSPSAFRRKKDFSLQVGFELVRDGRVSALVSAGNSGAVMAGALLVLGRLPGVGRPAIVTR